MRTALHAGLKMKQKSGVIIYRGVEFVLCTALMIDNLIKIRDQKAEWWVNRRTSLLNRHNSA
jgi:hypothetical protein